MADHNSARLVVWASLLGLPLLVRCSADDTHEGKSRLLDQACAGNGCTLQGSARLTSGPTADSKGLRLGPGQGQVRIPIPPFSHADDDSYAIELLVSGTGSVSTALHMRLASCSGVSDGGVPFGPGCIVPIESTSSIPLSREFEWVAVGGSSGAEEGSTFEGLLVDVDVTDNTTELELVDVRFTTYSSNLSCSVARVGGR